MTLPVSCWRRAAARLRSGLPLLLMLAWAAGRAHAAPPLVPGTGEKLTQVGDDFEAEDWQFIFNGAKSSQEQDENTRGPLGYSKNGRWVEGVKRGYPDIIKRVTPPEGGVEGSKGALLMQTLRSGVPGQIRREQMQDDLICSVSGRLRHAVPPSWSPSAVVRVYLPPWEEWEQRNGSSFGFRLGCRTTTMEEVKGFFRSSYEEKSEPYWPGMFLQRMTEKDKDGKVTTYAQMLIRGNTSGHEIRGPKITSTGWWTLGMSVTPDGQVHYYASPGVDKLTAKDYITSQFPYGFRAQSINSFFFNLANFDDGKTWSTAWIIDDAEFYVVRGRVASTNTTGKK